MGVWLCVGVGVGLVVRGGAHSKGSLPQDTQLSSIACRSSPLSPSIHPSVHPSLLPSPIYLAFCLWSISCLLVDFEVEASHM